MMPKEVLTKLQFSFEDVVGDPDRFRRVLDEEGVAIVTGIASPEECASLEHSWMASLAALKDGDATEALSFAPGLANGFTPLWGLPHSEFSWRCRTHPALKRVFEIVYSEESLCVSLDLPFYLPKASAPAPPRGKVAPHTDQNLHVPDSGQVPIFQSILYVWDSTGPDASSTVVCPGSHRELWGELMQDPKMLAMAQRSDHFCLVAYMQDAAKRAALTEAYQRRCYRAPVPAGGLLVWNSRVFHQGYTPGPRLAQPVVWEPMARRPLPVLLNKMEYSLRGLPTTHWAHLGLLHHVCRNLVGKTGKCGVDPKCVAPGHRASVMIRPEDRWVRSFAAGSEIEMDSQELSELFTAAREAPRLEGPAFDRLVLLFKLEIFKIL